jgi:TPR repeat protein
MNQESRFDEMVAKAAEGDAEAQFMVGEFYNSEGGVTIYEIGEWYLKAANQNHARAQLALGLLYLEWLPDEDYREQAQYWIEKAAQSGCEAAVKVLAELGPADEDMDGAVLLVEADEGNPQAQFELGCMLYYGQSSPRNVSAGLGFLFKAAIAGHPKAQLQIGSHYLFWGCATTDGCEAIKWLSLSAKQNDHFALYCLGYCYYEGIGVIKNDEQAATYFLRAARLGNSWAQFYLGRFYYEGVVFPENHEQAQSWLQAAATQGHEDAKELMEWMFS